MGAGLNFRERDRIKRKGQRWLAKFNAMPDAERAEILALLTGKRDPAPSSVRVAFNGSEPWPFPARTVFLMGNK